MFSIRRRSDPVRTALQLADSPEAAYTGSKVELTFMVTDIRGSTAEWAANDEATYRAIVAHDRIIVAAVESRGGNVFNMAGDSVLAAFEQPEAALEAALAARQALRVRDRRVANGEVRLADKVCIALHCGAVYKLGLDFRGLALCRASRMVGEGLGGEVLVSGRLAERLAGRLPAYCRLKDLGYTYLTGIETAQRIYQVEAEDAVPHPASPVDLPESVGQRTLTALAARIAAQMLLVGAMLLIEPASVPAVRSLHASDSVSEPAVAVPTACPVAPGAGSGPGAGSAPPGRDPTGAGAAETRRSSGGDSTGSFASPPHSPL